MATILKRLEEGRELEWNEVDDNFNNINLELIDNSSRLTTLENNYDILIITADHNLTTEKLIGVDVTGGSVLLNLKTNPVEGDRVFVFCAGGSYSANALLVGRNGSTIMDLAEDMTVSTDNISFELIYTGSTWRLG